MRFGFPDRRESPTPTRKGVVYLLVAIALFALLPLMALVLHTGLTSLTRRQMQTAVDTAALEALRYRDTADDGFANSRNLVRNQFDDDFNSGNGDPLNLGAGPRVVFTGGNPLSGSSFRASANASLPNPPVWKPELELNSANDRAGDMVAGFYDDSASDHSETSAYIRSDFDSDSVVDRNVDPYDSVLVRLRRSTESATTGVSVGPPVPFLFGRGPYGDTSLLDRRERGTIVRATAIARAEPAVVAGPVASNLTYGLTNFWVERDAWIGAPGDTPIDVTLDGSGTFAGGLAGEFVVDTDSSPTMLGASHVCMVGATWTARNSDEPLVSDDRFVPIYRDVNGTKRVIAFGLVNVTGASSTSMQVVLRTDALAPRNASSAFVRSPFDTGLAAPISRTDFSVVMTEFRLVSSTKLLRAPTSVRAID